MSEKITITKKEFAETSAKVTSDLMEKEKDLFIPLLLTGLIISDSLEKEIFKESDTATISKNEFSKSVANIISTLTKDDDLAEIRVPLMLTGILLVGQIKDVIFSEENLEREKRMDEVKEILKNNEEV